MTRKKDVLSNSEQCEKGLLCSFIRSPEKVGDLCLFRNVTEKWFYDEDRQKIFTCLTQMRKEGKPIETLSVVQYCIDNDHKLKFATPFIDATVMDSSEFIATASNATYYIDQLQKCLAKREFQLALLRTTESLKTTTELQDIYALVTGSFREVEEACRVNEHKDHDKEALMAFIDDIESMHRGDNLPEFFKLGIPDLDSEVGGAMRGEVIVIHGQTSTGKSLYSQHILQLNCVELGKKGEVFSMEMPSKQYLRRLTSSLGRIHLNSLKNGRFTKQEFNSFSTTLPKIMSANIGIHDLTRNAMSMDSIEAAIRKVKKNKGCDIVVIDYLQLIKPPKKKAESRRDQDLSSMSSTFKRIAQELEMVVILVAQANEGGTVFDSSQVESDADWVFNMIPTKETVGKITRITGTNGVWLSKAREGRRGIKFDLVMHGQFATLEFQPNIK